MKSKQIIVLSCMVIAIFSPFIWIAYNKWAKKFRAAVKAATPPPSTRSSDVKMLSPLEERVKAQAKKLITKGRIIQASQMLEQIGLHRDAISALEDAKLIDEAAKILLRIQNPLRAAAVYSRHEMWSQAAQCYLAAGSPLEAAKCYREAKLYKEAGDLFAKEQNHVEAAECMENIQKYAEAGKQYSKARDFNKALNCWNILAADDSAVNQFKPSTEDLKIIFSDLKFSKSHPNLIKIVALSPDVHHKILELLELNNLDVAISLYKLSPSHTSGSLLSEVNIQSKAAKPLAQLFESVQEARFAAILLEQLGMYKEASERFKESGDLERATYCFERAGDKNSGKPNKSQGEAAKIVPISIHKVLAPKANFVIEPGEDTARLAAANNQNESNESNPKEDELSINHHLKLPLTEDELKLLSRSWLFDNTDEQDLAQVTDAFFAKTFEPGDSFNSGSPETFLIMLISGQIHSKLIETPQIGDWVTPEMSLTSDSYQNWTVESSCRILAIKSSDFNRILDRDVSLTRQVYINLTLRLRSEQHNSSKLKAI